ncbi:glycosyltransferase family 2 protein [Cerasicoccus maritimus]|uniref:glycosyltransferase family 2 protein n=1 Tax=Cerasicoccus maritimus TaxID=490089 RepID=UPI002852CA9A|nr:glycosyltransferase family 2 protein [Cerasicoccus maritimus]
MSTSLVAITLIKDEGDIILASLQNLYNFGIRLFAIMDNDSSDATLDQVHKFRRLHDDASVLIVQDFKQSYLQSMKVTALAQMAIDYFSATHVYPFDADEFLQPVNNSALQCPDLLAEMDNDAVSLRWRTCIVCDEGVVYQCCNCSNYKKTLVRWSPELTINSGNHSATLEYTDWRGRIKRKECEGKELSNYEVLHIPVRSADQLRSKILNGAPANFVNRHAGIGIHWTALHDLYLQNGETFFQDFFDLLLRGEESELAAYCAEQGVQRDNLCYFNDYFLPRHAANLTIALGAELAR